MVAPWTIHFTIVLYIFAGDPIDQRSIFITYLGDSLISWWSKKQNVDFGSNTESKYCEGRSNIQIAHNDVFTLSVIIFKTTISSYAPFLQLSNSTDIFTKALSFVTPRQI